MSLKVTPWTPRVGVGAGLVRPYAFLERQHQPGALRNDERLATEGRNARASLRRRLEERDAALSTDVPLEVDVPRRLSREVGRPQAQRQRRDRDASDERAHH